MNCRMEHSAKVAVPVSVSLPSCVLQTLRLVDLAFTLLSYCECVCTAHVVELLPCCPFIMRPSADVASKLTRSLPTAAHITWVTCFVYSLLVSCCILVSCCSTLYLPFLTLHCFFSSSFTGLIFLLLALLLIICYYFPPSCS
jgi:hypothetical protein